MAWRVIETRAVEKQIRALPQRVQSAFRWLVEDLERDGPYLFGWDTKALKGRDGIRIKLVRDYRVIIEIYPPDIIVVTVAHRKEVYR